MAHQVLESSAARAVAVVLPDAAGRLEVRAACRDRPTTSRAPASHDCHVQPSPALDGCDAGDLRGRCCWGRAGTTPSRAASRSCTCPGAGPTRGRSRPSRPGGCSDLDDEAPVAVVPLAAGPASVGLLLSGWGPGEELVAEDALPDQVAFALQAGVALTAARSHVDRARHRPARGPRAHRPRHARQRRPAALRDRALPPVHDTPGAAPGRPVPPQLRRGRARQRDHRDPPGDLRAARAADLGRPPRPGGRDRRVVCREPGFRTPGDLRGGLARHPRPAVARRRRGGRARGAGQRGAARPRLRGAGPGLGGARRRRRGRRRRGGHRGPRGAQRAGQPRCPRRGRRGHTDPGARWSTAARASTGTCPHR